MDVPSKADNVVEVSAYLTDETFGYDHWRAAQFSAPKCDLPGVLLLFGSEEARAEWLASCAIPRREITIEPRRPAARRGHT